MKKSADQWACFAFEGMHSSEVRAQDLTTTTAVVGQQICKACQAPHRCMLWADSERDGEEGRFLCSMCGAPWATNVESVSQTEVKVALRPGTTHARMTNSLELKWAVEDLIEKHNGDAKIYIAFCLGFSIVKISEAAKPNGWSTEDMTEWKVRMAVCRGREAWGKRLRRMGIKTLNEGE